VRLTTGGKAVMVHVRRMLADFDAVFAGWSIQWFWRNRRDSSRRSHASVGEPLRSLLIDWRERYPNVAIKLHEMNEREIAEALVERRWMWR
jgi:DNA-binding transcriptional LysR family regulator